MSPRQTYRDLRTGRVQYSLYGKVQGSDVRYDEVKEVCMVILVSRIKSKGLREGRFNMSHIVSKFRLPGK